MTSNFQDIVIINQRYCSVIILWSHCFGATIVQIKPYKIPTNRAGQSAYMLYK